MDNKEERRIKRTIALFPFYHGFNGDLLFWIAIDTLYFRLVKGLTPSEIVSTTTIATVCCIVFQYPILLIVRKIGNVAATRVGSGILVAASLLLTFGPGYPFMIAGEAAHELAFSFILISTPPLVKNNTLALGQPDGYIPVQAKGSTIYSAFTMLIAFVASPMFNISPYLPMACCIATTATGFIMTFFFCEAELPANAVPEPQKTPKKKVVFGLILVFVLISYGLYFSVSNEAQTESKLFTQETISKFFDEDTTVLFIGYMVAASRIVRVIANILFAKLHKIIKEKVVYFLLVLLPASLTCFLAGYYLISDPMAQFIIMAIGYLLLLFLRDPFKLCAQDMVLKLTRKEDQQTVFALMDFLRKLMRAALNISFSLLLLSAPLVSVIWILFSLSLVELVFGIITVAKFSAAQKKKESAA